MTCPNCGGHMIGDGHTMHLHCERTAYQPDREPDAAPVYCDDEDDDGEDTATLAADSVDRAERVMDAIAPLYKGVSYAEHDDPTNETTTIITDVITDLFYLVPAEHRAALLTSITGHLEAEHLT